MLLLFQVQDDGCISGEAEDLIEFLIHVLNFYLYSQSCSRKSRTRHAIATKGIEPIDCLVAEDLKAGLERVVVIANVTTDACPLLSVVVKVVVATDVTTTLTNEEESKIPEFPGAAVIAGVVAPAPAGVASVCTGVSK